MDHAKELADVLQECETWIGYIEEVERKKFPIGNKARETLARYRAAIQEDETPVTGEWYESVGGEKRCADEPEWSFVATPTTGYMTMGYIFTLTDAEGNVYTRAKFKKRCQELGIQLKGHQ
jgi:hypothetical protein